MIRNSSNVEKGAKNAPKQTIVHKIVIFEVKAAVEARPRKETADFMQITRFLSHPPKKNYYHILWWHRQKSFFNIILCGRGKYIVFSLDIAYVITYYNSMINKGLYLL